MTVNELSSKVNLPALALYRGVTGSFNYKKIEGFGWLGFNEKTGFIFDLLMLFPEYTWDKGHMIYRFLARDHPEFQECKMWYSDVTEGKFQQNYGQLMLQKLAYQQAREEAETGAICHEGKQVRFKTLLAELGMLNLLSAGIGLITPAMLKNKEIRYLGWSEKHANKLLIPSFYAPERFASLEVASIAKIKEKELITKSREKGWYGELNHTIVADIEDLMTMRGCTWDPKIDHWTTKPVTLSSKLTVPQCIEIWAKAEHLVCDKSPIEVIKENHALEEVKHHIKSLSLSKVSELEKLTGEKLRPFWFATKSVEAEVFGTTFQCRNNRYYIIRGASTIEYTNFSVKLTKITRENGEFYQHGYIYYNDTETPFIAKRKAFNSYHTLLETLSDILLEAGIGTPLVAPNFKHYLTNVIAQFNQDNLVDNTIPAPGADTTTVSPLKNEPHPECKNEEVPHSQTPEPNGQAQGTSQVPLPIDQK